MRTRLIPRAEWFTFFQGFTRRHPRSLATLWLLGPRIGAQIEARDLALEGIVSDALATSISIQLGGTPGRNVEHPVAQPIGVWLEMTDDGDEVALGINSADGTTTLLELVSPVPPKGVEAMPAEKTFAPHAR